MKKTIAAILRSFAHWLTYQESESEKVKKSLKDGAIYWNYIFRNKVKVHQDFMGNFFITFIKLETGGNYKVLLKPLDSDTISQLKIYRKQDLKFYHR